MAQPTMTITEPRGHTPTLTACFLHFDVSFMLWVLLGALGVYIAEELKLGPSEKAMVVAIPILSGSLLRVPLGLLSDRFGGKKVGTIMLLCLYGPLTLGWLAGESLNDLMAIGALLGVAGASFAVALPLASRWYPPEKQGLAMGIAAAGNSGTVVTNLVAPRLAASIGWQGVMGVAMIPLTIALIAFVVLAKESPRRGGTPTMTQYLQVLKERDLWSFCLLYSVTFGGYVGLGSFLPLLLRDQYQVTPVTAGLLTALVAFVGSVSRPAGGIVADKVGGATLLSMLLGVIAVAYAACATLPTLPVIVTVLAVLMLCLGLGNGAVFQMVPQRFAREIGLVTGVVGAIGGIGGFILPNVLGQARAATGSFSTGFAVLTVLAAGAVLLLRALMASADGWKGSWREAEAAAEEAA
jgi:NNP family nitrate/nitrite transporter-like MFS transporter